MELHRTSGRRTRGFALAFLTMTLWGVLPLALEGVLRVMDPGTITWYRFLVSSLLVGAVLAARGRLPRLGRLHARGRVLLAVATVFLAANYLGYIVGLDWTSPADAQVLIQMAPLLLALGGIGVFGERFTRVQWAGFGVLVGGLALFFAGQLHSLAAEADRYLRGNAMIAMAAATWAVYGLAQKQLLRWLPSQHVMLCIYLGCTLLFLPIAHPAALLELDATALLLLGFVSLNTALAYGAFSEALEHWEATRVSAVLALTPLATLGFTTLAQWAWPDLAPPRPLGAAALVGAGLVVAGSLATSLGAERTA